MNKYFTQILPLLLFVGILAGQLVKLPSGTQGGVTTLDVTVLILDVFLLFNLKFKLENLPLWIKTGGIFIFATIISLISTPLKLSFQEYLLSSAYIFRFSSYLLLGWLIYLQPSILKNIKVYKILIYSGLGLAILGLLQLIFLPNLSFLSEGGWDPHYFRTASTLLDPNFTGSFLALVLILLVSNYQQNLKSKFSIFIFLIIYIALITTFSRSAAIVFLIGFLTLSLLKKSFKLLALTGILSIGFVIGYQIYHQVVAQPRNIDRGQSAEYRLNSWQQGLELFTRSPITGIGFNAYRFAIRDYQLGTDQFTQGRGSSTNDSSLLFVAATTGILGLLAYLGFIFSLIKTGLKNPSGAVLIAGLAGLLVNSFFINSLFYPWLLLWIVLVASQLSKTPSN